MTIVGDFGHYIKLNIRICQEGKTMKRIEQAKLTKKKIFKTAVDMIKKDGYENITVSDICQYAGVAKGTFYVHYSSKEDIVKESYYNDMADFMIEDYNKYCTENKDAATLDKIKIFLILELQFAQNMGVEMTSRAFSLNFAECAAGDSRHFSRRENFTWILCDLLKELQTTEQYFKDFLLEDSFLYLETFIRGLMASWCFSNGAYNLVDKGKIFIDKLIIMQS